MALAAHPFGRSRSISIAGDWTFKIAIPLIVSMDRAQSLENSINVARINRWVSSACIAS
jgi:hypothetical protein